jgi:hypothetical protein
VRYRKEHKEAMRRPIAEAAGRRLKRDGIDGAGVATLMATRPHPDAEPVYGAGAADGRPAPVHRVRSGLLDRGSDPDHR